MFLFERTRHQLQKIQERLGTIYQDLTASPNSSSGGIHSGDELMQAIHELQHCRTHIKLQHEVAQQLNKTQSLEAVVSNALEAIWLKAPLSFAVVILGEAELGPYQYHGVRGIPNAWRYLHKECTFPLSGVLARALLQRLDPNEPDYLYIPDLHIAERPTTDEFPWIPPKGSLLILPLRDANVARGALLLGRNEVDGFADSLLREEYQEITSSITKAIVHAQMKQEVSKNAEQLVNAQLLTRELTNASHFEAVIDALTHKLPEVMGGVDVQVIVRLPQHVLSSLKSPHRSSRQPLSAARCVTGATHGTGQGATEQADGHDTECDFQTILDGHFFAQSQSSEREAVLKPAIQRLFRWTLEVGEPVFYDPNNLEENPEHPYYSDSGRALLVPITSKDSTFGAIHVVLLDPLRRFDESDMVVLRTIANSTATALHNVELVHIQQWERIESMFTLISAAERRIPMLHGHNRRVMDNADLVAHSLGLDLSGRLLVRAGAALHDVAMLQLSDDELRRIYGSEWDEPHAAVARSRLGSKLLAESKIDKEIVSIVKRQGAPLVAAAVAMPNEMASTYEPTMQLASSVPTASYTQHDTHIPPVSHRNGHGPPHASVDSPLIQQATRIITVVDALDMYLCLSAQNPTREPMCGLQYIRRQAGIRFDPTLVQTLDELIAQDRVQWPACEDDD